jgi:hypothetical protein
MPIDSSMIRLLWSVVEETPSRDLLSYSDTALVKLLLRQIASKSLLTGEEVCTLYDYLGTKTALIRDIAESRLVQETCLRQRGFIARNPCLYRSLKPSQGQSNEELRSLSGF